MDERTPIDDHIAQPGPVYWDWLCLVCSEPVDAHVSAIRQVWRRICESLGLHR
jgi:hypothetical protein